MVRMVFGILFFLILTNSYASLCSYGPATKIGSIGIKEASGLAVSKQFPDRLYHHNDSGDSATIYVTKMDGTSLGKMKLSPASATDNEDMALAPCGDKQCIYLADIGDNPSKRGFIRITVAQEPALIMSTLSTAAVIPLQYPDGAHDAEAMAVHPISGDIYILTKSLKVGLYKISKDDFWEISTKPKVLKKVATLSFNVRPTSMDISPDGTKLLILTYANAYEYDIDLSKSNSIGSATKKTIGLVRLPQQEAVAYIDDTSFVYTTEQKGAVIMKVKCK